MWSSFFRRLTGSLDPSRYVSSSVQPLSSTSTLWNICQRRLFATKRYRTQRSKKKAKPAGPRRLIPAPSLHTKPPGFVHRSDKLTVHERKHEEFKQVMSRLEIKQFAWKSGDDGVKPREAMQLRKAAESVNPFENIPTFRKKSDCGPPPITMKKKKRGVTISAVTFGERTRGVGKVKSIKDQKKRLLNFRRPKRPAQLKTDKRDENAHE